jgi:hypothetical protein
MSKPHKILCISNGHGEDQVASRIVLALRKRGVEIVALPIVGEGGAYRRLGIPILDAVQTLPSGGFIYQDWRQFWRDLQGGLLGLTWRQLQQIKTQRQQADLVLAVGDIVVLLMAWWSGLPYGFVGTAKSDYYHRDEQGPYRRHWIPWFQPASDYLPWERWLMARPHCQGVFVRDNLTAKGLKALGLPALDLGNPMMDGLEPGHPQSWAKAWDPDQSVLLLLPGSRPPEAYANWSLMMEVIQQLPGEVSLVAAISPTLDLARLESQIPTGLTVHLRVGDFAACVQCATVALAMAGTATEQCVGLGKPVVTIPGRGPQFTPAFAEAQTRLLGSSIYLRRVDTAASTILDLMHKLRTDPSFTPQLHQHGLQRMGVPGAAERIATEILTWLEQ